MGGGKLSIAQFLKRKYIVGRSFGFYIGAASSLFLLVADIAFAAADAGDRTFSYVTFALIIVGALLWLAHPLFAARYCEIMPIVSCACYGAAFGMHLYLGLPTLSDVVNGVNFIGGRPEMVIIFMALFGLGMLGALVSVFTSSKKDRR